MVVKILIVLSSGYIYITDLPASVCICTLGWSIPD